jgi:PPM family protein phosphatase
MAENFFGITDTGKVRDNNEDAFIAETVMNNRFIIACAIDGVGGYSGGEIAAAITRESIFENFSKPSGDLIEAMRTAFIVANKKIFDEKLHTREHSKMACVLTLAIIDIENNQFYYAHVGDTRLYLLRDSSLVKISKDHSFVGFLEDSGRIDEDSAMKHLKRNEINKALGFGREIETQTDYIETGTSPFLPGDTLLLCSDGLTDMVNKEAITAILIKPTSLEEKANELVAEANSNGGKDNITVVLVQNNSTSAWQSVQSSGQALKTSGRTTNTNNLNPSATAVADSKKKEDTFAGFVAPGNSAGRGINKALAIACLLLLGSTLFLLWKGSQSTSRANDSQTAAVDTVRNPAESKLQDAINTATGDTLYLSDSLFNMPIVISDTLDIHQDSLFILSKGKVVLRADSAFRGPAFRLSTDSRFILLDGIQFENFDIAISAQNDALYLRNVQFLNCNRPVQNFFVFPDKQYVTGRLAGAYFFRTDSLNTPTN